MSGSPLDPLDPTSLLLLGAGRMGGALLAGLRRANPATEVLVVDPHPPPGPERTLAIGERAS